MFPLQKSFRRIVAFMALAMLLIGITALVWHDERTRHDLREIRDALGLVGEPEVFEHPASFLQRIVPQEAIIGRTKDELDRLFASANRTKVAEGVDARAYQFRVAGGGMAGRNVIYIGVHFEQGLAVRFRIDS